MALFQKLFKKRTFEFEQVKKDLLKDLNETIQMCDQVAAENRDIQQRLLDNLRKIDSLL